MNEFILYYNKHFSIIYGYMLLNYNRIGLHADYGNYESIENLWNKSFFIQFKLASYS